MNTNIGGNHLNSYVSKNYPFRKWTWKVAGWAFVCFFLISIITAFFSFTFDPILFDNKMGYYYSYFAIIFYTLILYFFYERFGNNWFGLFGFGLSGVIGIPIEYFIEWQVNHSLKSPWYAVAWGGIYVLYGLTADLLYWIFKLQQNQILTVIGSAALFSILFILISYLPLKTFYVTIEPSSDFKDYLQFWYFMIPFSVIEGIIGAYAGTKIAQTILNKDSKNVINHSEGFNK